MNHLILFQFICHLILFILYSNLFLVLIPHRSFKRNVTQTRSRIDLMMWKKWNEFEYGNSREHMTIRIAVKVKTQQLVAKITRKQKNTLKKSNSVCQNNLDVFMFISIEEKHSKSRYAIQYVSVIILYHIILYYSTVLYCTALHVLYCTAYLLTELFSSEWEDETLLDLTFPFPLPLWECIFLNNISCAVEVNSDWEGAFLLFDMSSSDLFRSTATALNCCFCSIDPLDRPVWEEMD
jgi:hypothetical protein